MKVLSREELHQLISIKGKEKAFLLVSAHRDFLNVARMISYYGPSITRATGKVSLQLHPDYPHLKAISKKFALEGNALDMCITGNLFPLSANTPSTQLIALVQLLVENGCPANDTRYNSRPLHRILEDTLKLDEGSKLTIVEILLRAGANPYAFKGLSTQLPLDTTSSQSLKTKTAKLLQKYTTGPSICIEQLKKVQMQKIALFEAILEKNIQKVRTILQSGLANPYVTFKYQGEEHSLVTLSLMYSTGEITLDLLKARSSSNNVSKKMLRSEAKILVFSDTCLLQEICLELIKQGLDMNQVIVPETKNLFFYRMPLRLWHYFCIRGEKDLVRFLLEQFETLAVDLPNRLTIFALLHPQKYPRIQAHYDAYLDERAMCFGFSPIDFLCQFNERLQLALDAEDKGEANAVKAVITATLNESSREQTSILQKKMDEYSLRYNSAFLKEIDFAKHFMQEMVPLFTVWKFNQACAALFQGESEVHKDICQLILNRRPDCIKYSSVFTKGPFLSVPKIFRLLTGGHQQGSAHEEKKHSILSFFCVRRRQYTVNTNKAAGVSSETSEVPCMQSNKG